MSSVPDCSFAEQVFPLLRDRVTGALPAVWHIDRAGKEVGPHLIGGVFASRCAFNNGRSDRRSEQRKERSLREARPASR